MDTCVKKILINTTLSSCILFKKITNKRKKTKKGGGAMKGMTRDHQNQGFCNCIRRYLEATASSSQDASSKQQTDQQTTNHEILHQCFLEEGSPGDTWRILETFLVVATGLGECYLCNSRNTTKHPSRHETASHNEGLSNPNGKSAAAGKPPWHTLMV